MSLAVVGADYPNKRGPSRRFEIALCTPGEPVELRPEPDNRKDKRAVAVYSVRGVQLGYVPAERAPRLGKIIRDGHTIAAVFQAKTDFGAVIRLEFDGAAPTLPEAPPDQQSLDDNGFWPDEIPPDSV